MGTSQTVKSRSRDLARREQPKLKLCFKHPQLVHHDEGFCPACKTEQEIAGLGITKSTVRTKRQQVAVDG